MYEDGEVIFEVDEKEYELVCNTFANELCSWVTIELLSHFGDRMIHFCTWPGTHFWIEAPENHPRLRGVSIYINPVSEDKVVLDCIETSNHNVILSPRDAVDYILKLFD